MYLTGSVKQEQLKTEQTKFTSNLFQKEAMRIYVQDCLEDELEYGLILLGKQGRIWDDQSGGVKHFEEGKTGASYDEERVLFGISREEYPSFQNAYPCNNDTNSTEFCQYKRPDIKVGFGNLELKESTLEEDLQRYLINRTLWCVENFTKSNISQNAELVTKKLELTVDIIQEGINVKVYFPLKLKIGKEEISQLTQFDFFYPSRFNDLLDAAVGDPLFRDWKMLDFNYTQSNLESFSANYNSLSIKMEKKETSNGDNFFKFTPALFTIINKPINYSFTIARQNRPPALDYVERNGCPKYGYDYLVIAGENDSNGEINITLNAIDADEDKINYSFMVPSNWLTVSVGPTFGSGSGVPISPSPNILLIPISNQTLYIPKDKFIGSFIYNLTANSTDEHNLSDWQTVRVLVDRPLTVNVTVSSPYADIEGMVGGTAIVSPEDPVFINITLPKDSLVPNPPPPQITLNYSSDDGSVNWGYEIPLVEIPISSDGCYSFPLQTGKKCKAASYGTANEIVGLFPDDTFGSAKTNGALNLYYSMDYCSNMNASKSIEISVYVVPCIPHKNPERPFAYNPTGNYHKYKFGLNADGSTNFSDINETPSTPGTPNPLKATHSCCVGQPDKPGLWRLADETDLPCFVNPLPGCYGGITEYKAVDQNYGGYVLESETRLCDGKRGNTCEGNKVWKLWDGELRCGHNNLAEYPNCKKIETKCQGQLAWGYVDSNNDGKTDSWCHGKMGCNELCKSPEMIIKSLSKVISPGITNMNVLAKNNNWITDVDLGYTCGKCTDTNEDQSCDGDFDGTFGTCKHTGCIGD
jgi:hypothetical protein